METIMVLKVNHRDKKAPTLQELLTKYGCLIKVRLGLHEAGNVCSSEGLILLQLDATDAGELEKFTNEISAMEGLAVKTIQI
jgi:hypothetical protein